MESVPKLEIGPPRVAFRDEHHNAFTDLCQFRGYVYLTFRTCPDGHGISRHASIRVMRSADGKEWEQVTQFQVEDRDTRDPHFLVFKGFLFVYTGTWLCPENHTVFDINDHLGYTAWTEDGETWKGPTPLEGTYGHYIWRAAVCRDTAYLCARRKWGFAHNTPKGEGGDITQAAMLESDDGFRWQYRSLFTEHWGDETAFVFDENGTCTALARRLAGKEAMVCRSSPAYSSWERVTLDRYVGGPMLARWNGHLLVGGRKTLDGPPVTTLYWLINDALVEIAELPSGGDTSYTGFTAFDNQRGLLSYYSSHETGGNSARAAIYLVDLTFSGSTGLDDS